MFVVFDASQLYARLNMLADNQSHLQLWLSPYASLGSDHHPMCKIVGNTVKKYRKPTTKRGAANLEIIEDMNYGTPIYSEAVSDMNERVFLVLHFTCSGFSQNICCWA